MTEELNLAEYTAAHRIRRRGMEDGYVDKTGVREKKWRGWYHVYGKKEDGTETRIKRKRIIGPVKGMSKAEAQEEHRVWIRRLHALPAAETPGATVATLCDDLFELRDGDWEKATYSTNKSVFNLIKGGLGPLAIDQVKADDLKRFVKNLPKRTWKTPGGKVKSGVSVSYIKKTISQLRGIFDLASEKDLIRKNPARSLNIRLTVPKLARKPDKTVFPPSDLLLLLKVLKERDRIVVWLSMLGATRPGELFAIEGRDVGPGWVHIEKSLDRNRKMKDTKTDKPRYIHVPSLIAQELKHWIETQGVGPADLVFRNRKGKPLNRSYYLEQVLRKAAQRAGIMTLDVDFQMLRRSFATLAQVVGLDVKAIQSQLGHSRPDMTATEYMQPLDALTCEKMDRLEGMLRGTIEMPADVTAKLGSRLVQ